MMFCLFIIHYKIWRISKQASLIQAILYQKIVIIFWLTKYKHGNMLQTRNWGLTIRFLVLNWWWKTIIYNTKKTFNNIVCYFSRLIPNVDCQIFKQKEKQHKRLIPAIFQKWINKNHFNFFKCERRTTISIINYCLHSQGTF